MLAYWRTFFNEINVRATIIVKGDDVLFCVPQFTRDTLTESIIRNKLPIYFSPDKEARTVLTGQIVKTILFGPLKNLDFLSADFIETAAGYRMVRKLPRVLGMLPWCGTIT